MQISFVDHMESDDERIAANENENVERGDAHMVEHDRLCFEVAPFDIIREENEATNENIDCASNKKKWYILIIKLMLRAPLATTSLRNPPIRRRQMQPKMY